MTLEKVSTHHRLSLEMYKVIEGKVQNPFVGDKTTEIQAGFQLGIQHMLKILRDDFTIGA